jgi:hypothetical protein
MTTNLVEASASWLQARLDVLNREIQRLRRTSIDSDKLKDLLSQAAEIHSVLRLRETIDWSFPEYID